MSDSSYIETCALAKYRERKARLSNWSGVRNARNGQRMREIDKKCAKRIDGYKKYSKAREGVAQRKSRRRT